MLILCDYCDIETRAECPLCDGSGVLEPEFEDIAVLVNEIHDLLLPIVKDCPALEDALAEAQPHLFDLLMKWG